MKFVVYRVQGINFLGLASAIKHLPSSSKTVS
ncbi:hypothetical protein AB210_3582 [Acinetobacter baumannii AB210]|nr:hypothetical protein AB210_3582 [Acinetobacter baumannii AB210]